MKQRVIENMKVLPDNNTNVRNTMGNLQKIAMKTKYDFFRSTTIPRGSEDEFMFKQPYVVVGKKIY